MVRAHLLLSLLLFVTACGSHRTPHAIADEAAVCVPSDTILLAGLHLARIRDTPLYPSLPATWRALLEPLRDANELLVAYNGRDLLAIARGRFSSAPPGTVLVGPTLALAGSPTAIRAAIRQRATDRTGAPALIARAEPAAGKPIWMVIQGHAALPLTGNLANLNRVLALVDYASVTADFNSSVDIRATGFCRTADDGLRLEEALRALISLAAVGTRDADLAALFRSAQVTREDLTVKLAISASLPALKKLLH
jgi:hypothetical protein